MDAFAKKRGLLRGDTTGVRDSVVNQLLAIMDGVREIDNFLVMTPSGADRLMHLGFRV